MGNIPLHPYDVVMLVILAVATFFGLWKGLAWQVASVASFVLSYVVAVQASSWLAPLLPWPAPWNSLAAMLILFVATSAAVWLVFRLVAGLIDKIQLKAFDRQLGALVGLFQGVLICLVVTFFGVTLSEALRQEVLRARSGYYIALLLDRIKPVLPPEVRDLVGQYIEELDRKLQQPPAPQHQENLQQEHLQKEQERLPAPAGTLAPPSHGLQQPPENLPTLGGPGTTLQPLGAPMMPLFPNQPASNR
jgi:membrane protein required for colicin V production